VSLCLSAIKSRKILRESSQCSPGAKGTECVPEMNASAVVDSESESESWLGEEDSDSKTAEHDFETIAMANALYVSLETPTWRKN